MRGPFENFIEGPLSVDRADARKAREALLGGSALAEGEEDEELGPGTNDDKRQFELGGDSPLFEYQSELIEIVEAYWRAGETRVMASLPTGGGKTRTAWWLARRMVERGECTRVLWVAPSVELLTQSIESLQAVWRESRPAPRVSVAVDELANPRGTRRGDAAIVCCTAQMAFRNLAKIRAYDPSLFVFDEAHQAAARSFRRLIDAAAELKSTKVVGLSATPGRSLGIDGEILARAFGRNLAIPSRLGADPVKTLTDEGVLAKLERKLIDLPRQWQEVRVGVGKGSVPSLERLALNKARFWSVVDATRQVASRRRCLVFGSSIAHCEALGAVLTANGIRCETVSTYTEPKQRERLVAEFRTGKLEVLLNKSILGVGYDDPKLEDVVLAGPVRSPVLWEQIVGRVTRGPKVGGTAQGRIWEVDDHDAIHDRVMAAQRFEGELW